MPPHHPNDDAAYAERLARLQGRWWKRLLDVQRPYRWYLRKLQLGFVLDLGCGLGRSLTNAGGNGVGVDVNPYAVQQARARGLQAFEPEEFAASQWARPGSFDSLILAHVVEHMRFDQAQTLLSTYLPLVKKGGTVVLIAPQERGFASDATHVEMFGFASLQALLVNCNVRIKRSESFPLPRWMGHVFPHNEFVVIGEHA